MMVDSPCSCPLPCACCTWFGDGGSCCISSIYISSMTTIVNSTANKRNCWQKVASLCICRLSEQRLEILSTVVYIRLRPKMCHNYPSLRTISRLHPSPWPGVLPYQVSQETRLKSDSSIIRPSRVIGLALVGSWPSATLYSVFFSMGTQYTWVS
jgi:hypothetical protein